MVSTLDKPELSPRELAVRYTDQQAYFVVGCHLAGIADLAPDTNCNRPWSITRIAPFSYA